MNHAMMRVIFSGALITAFTVSSVAAAQLPASQASVTAETLPTVPITSTTPSARPVEEDDLTMDEVRRQLRAQREEIERLQSNLQEQSRLINELRARMENTEQAMALTSPRNPSRSATDVSFAVVSAPKVGEAAGKPLPAESPAAGDAQDVPLEERLKRAEAQVQRTSESLAKQLGSISISGDLRFRYESFYGQINSLANSADSSVLGNELSARHRLRVRGRLALRGQIGKEFDWGLRFATGNFPDVTSTNPTLTDFYSHKNFALDQIYISYRPTIVPGLQVRGGKFDIPWIHTEMTIDADIQPEGLSQSYTRSFEKSVLKDFSVAAWQLPFLERAAGFVLGANGKVDFEESRRQGRDLALYGAQARARFALSQRLSLTLSAADLYYSGTQFITPVQIFGSQVQFPVTVTIPATATTPAQTLVGQVTIARDQLVSGNANLGISTATNNSTNRDGRLASGFNLVDLIGRLDLTHSKRFPVMLLFNFVTNTQARDVISIGPGGINLVQRNKENRGYWAEAQVGRTQQRGDWLLNYTLMRIEKDAVLTPFNFSDLVQPSDVRAQRFIFAYAADPRVTLSLTGIVSRRANGLLGVFGSTPPGSLNRPTTRLQLDTVIRF